MWQIYDEMGTAFLAHAERNAYNALYDRPAVLAVAGEVSGLDVLDAGCGPGLYAEELARRGASVTAIDASEEQLRIARERLPATTDVRRAVLGEQLPFDDAAFDLIVCALVIHYVADREAAFAEFHRVLRPGGRAVVSTQHPTIDWLRKGGSYFDVKEEDDVWNTPQGAYRVRYWREPLTTLTEAATDAGFLISRLVEPLPDAAMKAEFPEDWKQLHDGPGFLILELLKASA